VGDATCTRHRAEPRASTAPHRASCFPAPTPGRTGACHWRDELEAMQQSAQRMGYPPAHPAATFTRYRPTEEWVEHPCEPGVQGRGWRYHQPPAAPRRVLVTGSRTWTNTTTIRDALASVLGALPRRAIRPPLGLSRDRILRRRLRGIGRVPSQPGLQLSDPRVGPLQLKVSSTTRQLLIGRLRLLGLGHTADDPRSHTQDPNRHADTVPRDQTRLNGPAQPAL